MKRTVAILDDDMVFVNRLKELLERWSDKESQELVIEGFARAEDLVSGEKIYDLVFMDIILPKNNGIELYEKLKQEGRLRDVIYMSAYDRNVFQVFGSRPIAYIRKAFIENDLKKAMDLYQIYERNNKVFIRDGKKIHAFYPNEIMYLQSNKHYIEFYMEDGRKDMLRGKMNDMEEVLKDYGYIRVHASYLINIKYIRCIEKNYIQLYNFHCCKISLKYKKEVSRRFYGGE